MKTISLKLSDKHKEKMTNAAKALGMSPNAFMVEAIKQAIHNTELRLAFLAQGNAAKKQATKTGKGYKALMDRLEDLELNTIADSCKGQKTIRVSHNDL
jgi:predicted transcriptional regulator